MHIKIFNLCVPMLLHITLICGRISLGLIIPNTQGCSYSGIKRTILLPKTQNQFCYVPQLIASDRANDSNNQQTHATKVAKGKQATVISKANIPSIKSFTIYD